MYVMSSVPLPWPSRLERLRSGLRIATVAVVTALVAFHGWLLAAQITDGRIADPWLVVRWFAAVALVAALVAVRRGGASIWGRQGITIWVLAAVLHGPAVASHAGNAFDSLALPEVVVTSVLQVVASAVLAAGLWLLAGLLAHRSRLLRRIGDFHLAFSAAGILADGFSPPFSARPPPQKS